MDKFNAGDDVVIVGNIVRRWRPVSRGVRCGVDIALEAVSVVALNAADGAMAISASSAAGPDAIAFWKYHGRSEADLRRALFSWKHSQRNRSDIIINRDLRHTSEHYAIGSVAKEGRNGVLNSTTQDFSSLLENDMIEPCLQGRNVLVRSVCPQLYGLFYVKLALLLALVGGVDTPLEGGIRRRSHIHMLMVRYRLVSSVNCG